ncbi:MAG: hypothetical protein AAF610_01780 [Pseudomonadota bacterium]
MRSTLYAFSGLLFFATPQAHAVFINELHYDNAGVDQGEGVEIAGLAGTDLTGYQIVLYNGTNGTLYRRVTLDGELSDQQNGYGTRFFDVGSIQNGDPDGLALIDATGNVLQFLSYEGAFTASDGEAAGMASTDIGVAENSDHQVGWSLQLTGIGLSADDFQWVIGSVSYGSPNTDQSFAPAPVPLPAALPALLGGLAWLGRLGRSAR